MADLAKTRRLEVMCLHLRARPDGMETKLYIGDACKLL